MEKEHILLLGEIKGKLDAITDCQTAHGKKLDAIDTRLRHVETKSAIHGGVVGGIVAIGIEVIKHKLLGGGGDGSV